MTDRHEPDYFAPNVTDARDKFGVPKFEPIRGSDTPLDTGCKDYIIKDLLAAGDVGVVYGPPAAGKSFAVLRLVRQIPAGDSILGHRVRPVNVLYVTLEGAQGFKKRVYAIEQRYDPQDPFFYICCRAADFQNKAFMEKALQTIADYEIGLVVIDTLARFLCEQDENTGQGMAHATKFADEVARRSGAATLFVAHSGKDAGRGLRGHSSIIGAVDLECVIERGEDGGRTLTLKKVKDGPDGVSYAFDLETVDLGRDDEGDPMSTCIATDFRKIVTDAKTQALTPTEQKWLDAFHEFFASDGGKERAIPSLNHRKVVSGNIAEIRACFQRIGTCPGAVDSGNTPETEKECKARERRNNIAISKWAGALRSKGKVGYDNGLIWLVEGAQ